MVKYIYKPKLKYLPITHPHCILLKDYFRYYTKELCDYVFKKNGSNDIFKIPKEKLEHPYVKMFPLEEQSSFFWTDYYYIMHTFLGDINNSILKFDGSRNRGENCYFLFKNKNDALEFKEICDKFNFIKLKQNKYDESTIWSINCRKYFIKNGTFIKDEIAEWIEETCSGECHYAEDHYYFKNKDDAALFKLVWC